MSAFAKALLAFTLLVLVLAQFASTGRDRQMTHDINAVRLAWALQLDRLVQNASIHQSSQRLRLVELDHKLEALAEFVNVAEGVANAER